MITVDSIQSPVTGGRAFTPLPPDAGPSIPVGGVSLPLPGSGGSGGSGSGGGGQIFGSEPVRPQGNTPPTNTQNITINTGGSSSSGESSSAAVDTSVPATSSSLGSILGALSSLFQGLGSSTSSPSAPQAIAVPIQNGSAATDATTGRGVVVIAGVVLGLGVLAYYAIKHGWFKKAAGAASSAAAGKD